MPAGKPSQSNAMLYTVITFVALFIIAATCAVIFYVKAEDYKTQSADARDQLARVADSKEQGNMSKLVGKSLQGKSYLGTMSAYLDQMLQAVTGRISEDTPAEVKVNEAAVSINDTMKSLGDDASAKFGPEGISLLDTIRTLKSELDMARENMLSIEKKFNQLQNDFDDASAESRFKEQKLVEEKNRFQTEADRIQTRYNELEKLAKLSFDQQVQTYMDKLEKAEDRIKQKDSDIARLNEQLGSANDSLQVALKKLEQIKPRPDVVIAAFKPDARIIKVDLQTNLVYLDIGSDNHVYRGLTFGIYDKSAALPEDGKGKAEIEVFQVEKNLCTARIIDSSKKNPIVSDDIVANLIWDSKSSNMFVLVGDFDFDGDGHIDNDGLQKVTRLIERWGGGVQNQVTIETDFIVLGEEPALLAKPSAEQLELDPMAEQRYQQSIEQAARYNEIISRAGTLNIPIFNQKRFFNLIGYRALASRSTPF